MEQELTYGQKLTGVNFNPSEKRTVAKIKQAFADLIDMINDAPKKPADPTAPDKTDWGRIARHSAIAITEAETACMYAVKAAVFNPNVD